MIKISFVEYWDLKISVNISIKNTPSFQYPSTYIKIMKQLCNILKLVITRTSRFKTDFHMKYFSASDYEWNTKRMIHTDGRHGKEKASSDSSWRYESNRHKNINRHVQLCQHSIPFESFCIIWMIELFVSKESYKLASCKKISTWESLVSLLIHLFPIHPFSTTWCFQWVEKGYFRNKWVKQLIAIWRCVNLLLPSLSLWKKPIFSVFYVVVCIWMFSYSKL